MTDKEKQEAVVALSTLSPEAQQWEVLKEQTRLMWESGLLPRNLANPKQALYIAAKGKELNIGPCQALSSISIIQGKAAISSELMLALVYRAHPSAQVSFLTPSEKAMVECEAEFTRPGGKPNVFKFTIEDAKRAGITSNPTWQKYPAAMLRARVISIGCRAVFPDALCGCSYTPEELGGEPDIKEIDNRPVNAVVGEESDLVRKLNASKRV